jgi:hypothetical protein
MDISNKTKRPLKISLPGGKLLRLGPGRIGQIAPQAAEHPAVKKLIEAGEIEIVGGGKSQGANTQSSSGGGASSSGHGSGGGTRHTGDR